MACNIMLKASSASCHSHLNLSTRSPRSPAAATAAAAGSLNSSTLKRDVRPVPIKLITVSKGNSPGAVMMASEWLEKLARYTQVSEVQIKPNPKKTTIVELQKEAEGDKVVKAIDSRDWVVLCDERGRAVTSEDLAVMIGRAGDEGRPLSFVIGGPFGHGPAVVGRSNEMIRLSNCVLNHQVAQVVLVEQLYRAWTILRGEPYHH